MRHKAIAHALLVALALAPAAALAITNDEVNRGLQFNFSNPGARSLALGGAFTGLADDATAAYANPAGLTILRKPEFGLEARSTQFDTPFASGGEAVFNPFDASGVGEDTSSDSVSQVSFASFVYPTERATFSFFYHKVGDFEGGVDSEAIEFVSASGNPIEQFLPAAGNLSYEVENFGAAVGFEVSDNFSIGATVAYSDFTLSSRTDRFADGEIQNTQRQNGNDDDIVFSVGALWQISPQWNFGLAYRSGGEFEYTASNDAGSGTSLRTEFAVPNVFSAGLAFRPTDAWLFSLDLNWVEYSRLTDDVDSVFPGVVADLDVDDGTEIRFGAEYAFLEMATPMFVRGGVWFDPDHRLAYGGPTPTDCATEFDACVDSFLFPEGDDETHFSLGVGWAFSTFVLDFAADFSDQVDTYSVSGVMRF
jgi:long-subunit fatty acid transport protein